MQPVGPDGQVVIPKEMLDRLGVQPGWFAVPRLVDGHVELFFSPPGHRRSLAGILAKFTTVHVGEGEEWERALEQAREAMAREWAERQPRQP